jgi:hypothetical protein
MSYFTGIWMIFPAAWTIFMALDCWAEDVHYRKGGFWLWVAGMAAMLLIRWLP